ncbi:hypothetical protein [Arthrospiribacter ruber]|uniref:Uncharacterized protein n=1 Tax=Arthrospiribacter ruber TaxID=2487934 RepID=A0A951MCM2_9BACT|nr:hypothetical protein [Arthrospiribacter ruber]MBW3467065.1 hypothetical protein [Arthrospiribacter ruber]
MKNKTKLILANMFALVAVVTIFSASKSLGIELGLSSQALVPTILLLAVPQMGFAYLYWKSSIDKKKALA